MRGRLMRGRLMAYSAKRKLLSPIAPLRITLAHTITFAWNIFGTYQTGYCTETLFASIILILTKMTSDNHTMIFYSLTYDRVETIFTVL